MYKLITSSKDSDYLSIGIDGSRNRRREETTNIKNVNGKYHLRIMIKGVLGFVECQGKASSGLN